MRQKQVVCGLVSIFLDNPQLGIQKKLYKTSFKLLIQLH